MIIIYESSFKCSSFKWLLEFILLASITYPIAKPWEEIKDYVIPFLKRFINEFSLSLGDIRIEMGLRDGRTRIPIGIKTVKLKDLVDNKLDEAQVHWIKIKKGHNYL